MTYADNIAKNLSLGLRRNRSGVQGHCQRARRRRERSLERARSNDRPDAAMFDLYRRALGAVLAKNKSLWLRFLTRVAISFHTPLDG